MKAEHRKELHTNTLAAGMGRLVQRVKTKPQRRTVLWVVLGLAVVAVVGGWWYIHNNRARQESELWALVNFPNEKSIDYLRKQWPNTKQGLAVRFQENWIVLWELGIKRLPTFDPRNSPIQAIQAGKKRYEDLADEVKDDKTLAAEARYNIAVATESLAVLDLKNLDEAQRLYKRVVEDYGETARAKDARDRLKLLEDPEGRRQVEELYNDLGTQTNIRMFHQLQQGRGKLPFPMPPGGP